MKSVRWLLLGLLLPGCAVGPDYVRPDVAVPSFWSETQTLKAVSSKTYAQWWQTFDDPVLDRLMRDAIAANLDLQQAEARIREARTQRVQTIAAGLPTLSAGANLNRRRNALSFSPSASGFGTGGFGIGQQIIDIFQMGFDAQWEVDLFGGVRRALEVAEANIEVQEENRRDILVTLLAEVARNYIDIRNAQQLIEVTRSNASSQQETLELVRARRQGGLTSELEVAQADAQVAATSAELPVLDTSKKQAVHALSILLGREPGALLSRFEASRPIPAAVNPAPADLPSELLRRRPDVRRTERQLAAASAEIGVATAELYPKVNLAAFLGLQNSRITDFTPIGKSWSMASSLSMPIFNWGKLQANIKAKKALYEQSFFAYRTTILTAFKEVEDALAAYANEQERRRSLARNVEASRLAVDLAKERYFKGLTSFLDVLTAEKALYQAQSDFLASEAESALQLVALYKALGGGWQQDPVTENRF
ncbi:efflux transporter outer membrane subunit [Methylosarcina fibrata]|uniref:efflux transporter outer membrane subunit n=1 Tax=Methylosarcina fibrata TaxID=105972 RepID=UPI00035EFC24|nr:efflux transporter outer membrane subunit [Methylosarcina fibrata]